MLVLTALETDLDDVIREIVVVVIVVGSRRLLADVEEIGCDSL